MKKIEGMEKRERDRPADYPGSTNLHHAAVFLILRDAATRRRLPFHEQRKKSLATRAAAALFFLGN